MTLTDGAATVAAMLDGGRALWLASGPRPVALPPTTGAVVETSGSTGTGKKVALGRDALLAAAAASRSTLAADLTWHLVLPPRYVAGLMVVVRSLVCGRQPIVASLDLGDLRARGDGDAVSVVGTQLHRALQDPAVTQRLARFDVVLVGGAALSSELRRRAEDAGIRVIETYGMSETCGGVLWDGEPLPGVTVELLPDRRASADGGRIALGGPTLLDGYVNESGDMESATRDGLFVTNDWGWREDGRLVVGGRLDDVVISGGVNVDLTVVRRAVEALDPDTAVLAVDDPEWGQRIVLFATHGSLQQWRDDLSSTLGRTALPRQLVVVPRLPRTQGGKPDRAALLAWVPR